MFFAFETAMKRSNGQQVHESESRVEKKKKPKKNLRIAKTSTKITDKNCLCILNAFIFTSNFWKISISDNDFDEFIFNVLLWFFVYIKFYGSS
jgi:hypothetical protein